MDEQVGQSGRRHAGNLSSLSKSLRLCPLKSLDDLMGQASDLSEREISGDSEGIVLVQSTNRAGLRLQIT